MEMIGKTTEEILGDRLYRITIEVNKWLDLYCKVKELESAEAIDTIWEMVHILCEYSKLSKNKQ